MKRALAEMGTEERRAATEKICARVRSLPQWQAAGSIMLYAPLRAEPDIGILGEDAAGKRVIRIPRKPDDAWLEKAEAVDIVLVPGLGFTPAGVRLGRGGGFFDRLLSGPLRRAFKVGLCFDCQLVSALPSEAHDVRMDAVITESSAT